MGLIVVPPEVLPGRFTMVFRPKDRLLNSMGHSYTVHRQIGEKEKRRPKRLVLRVLRPERQFGFPESADLKKPRSQAFSTKENCCQRTKVDQLVTLLRTRGFNDRC